MCAIFLRTLFLVALGASFFASPLYPLRDEAGVSRGGAGGGGPLAHALGGDAPSALRAGALPPSASPSPAPPSASGTPTCSPSGTGSGSGTPSGSGTGTPSGTPSGTPTPSASLVFGVAQCVAASAAYLRDVFAAAQVRAPKTAAYVAEYGSRYAVPPASVAVDNVHPLPADIVRGAGAAACPAAAAEAMHWEMWESTSLDDVCFVVRSTDARSTEGVASGWGSAVRSLWFVGATADPAQRMVAGEGGTGVFGAIRAARAQPGAAACKWFFLGTDRAWVNPRAVLHSVRGLPHDGAPLVHGFMWKDMGFTNLVTSPQGGTSVWSRSAWELAAAAVGGGGCVQGGLSSEEVALAHCVIARGVMPADFHLYDGSGAVQRAGVPLEPGPPDMSRLDWLAAPAARAGHWAWIDNLDAGWQSTVWAQYAGLYGPWGLAPGGSTPSPSARPPPSAAAAAAAPGSPPCAARAYAAQAAMLDAARVSPTSAQPLTLDAAVEATAASCGPAGRAAAGEPAGGPGGLRDAAIDNLCFALLEDPAGDGAQTRLMMESGWIGRAARAEGHRLLWAFGADPAVAGAAAEAPPGWSALPEGGPRVAAALAALAADAHAHHCEWFFLGSNTDWVSAPVMAGALRGLRPDVAAGVGFWRHGAGDVDEPALGKVVLSAAALRAMAPLLPGCAGAGAGAVARCTWAAGVIPITTYAMDVANFGPGTDWAFQQPHYSAGWALIVDQHTERNIHILEAYFGGLYGQAFNMTNDYSRASVLEFFTGWGYTPPPPARLLGQAGAPAGAVLEEVARVAGAASRFAAPPFSGAR